MSTAHMLIMQIVFCILYFLPAIRTVYRLLYNNNNFKYVEVLCRLFKVGLFNQV